MTQVHLGYHCDAPVAKFIAGRSAAYENRAIYCNSHLQHMFKTHGAKKTQLKVCLYFMKVSGATRSGI